MISRADISGFKSLRSFRLDVRPGLNVLVGPNGAGKTNIIEAFEFLSYLGRDGVSEAVGRLGGIGRLLTRIGEEEYASEISIRLYGEKIISSAGWYSDDEGVEDKTSSRRLRNIVYDYQIRLKAGKSITCVGSEKLVVRLEKVRRQRGKLEVVRSVGAEKPDIVVERTVKPQGVGRARWQNSSEAISFFGRKTQKEGRKDLADSVRNDQPGEYLLLAGRYYNDHPIFDVLSDEIQFESPLNINPTKVRESMPIGSTPGIQRDGSGLAATLWAPNQQRSANYRHSKLSRSRAYRISRFDKRRLVEYVRHVNPQVCDIDAYFDHWESVVRVKCKLEVDGKEVWMPISALSDGTLKWIALMTAILTMRSIFAVEEPENNIHPAVQRELVEILRERSSEGYSRPGLVLVSTHSETLINALAPEEIVVVKMEDGHTKCSRPDNAKLLNEEIQRTGFGLGYYYLTGMLDA